MTPPPSRAEVRQVLRDLIDEGRSRDEVNDWAESWMRDDIPFEDDAAWDTILLLSGAVAISTDRSFLYDRADFEDWLAELDAAPEQKPS